jgi:hypothetical protein
MLGLKLLAVAGGVAVGALACGLLLRFVAGFAPNRRVPRTILRLIQLLGGIALGLAVWFWAFGSGGGGFGSSGGLGLAGDGVDGEVTQQGTKASSNQAAPPSVQENSAQAPFPATPSMAETVRVELLGGGRVKGERFYLLEGEAEPCSLAVLRERLRNRMDLKDQPPLKAIELVIYEDSVAQDHPAVKDLDRWARQQGLEVSLSFPRRALP